MRNYIFVLFLGIVIVLLVVSFVAYRNLNNYINEVAGIRHSNLVLQEVQEVFSAIRDAETGHRGYQLTRDSTYLGPYYSSLEKLPAKLKILDSLLAPNALQSGRMDSLGVLINNQFSIINQILSNARRSSLYMDQYESALLARGKANMETIRQICTRITKDEEVTFRRRVTKETIFRENAPLSLLIYTLIALIGMTFLFTRVLDSLEKRKQAEKEMLIAERLSMTGKIARTIAHEVRNPLTNLNLALEQMKDEMPPDNQVVTLYGDIIERNAARIEQLMGEMLNSSRPRELNLELTQVPDVLEETLSLTSDRLNLNQMKLEKDFKADLPRLLLDRDKIKIALLNIVINAVEAMESGKGVLRISTAQQDGSIVVSISDNGKGISKDDLEKLFDPFYTAKPGGMGLGLTSAKNILSSHEATIKVTSKINQGTTFTIYFKLPPS